MVNNLISIISTSFQFSLSATYFGSLTNTELHEVNNYKNIKSDRHCIVMVNKLTLLLLINELETHMSKSEQNLSNIF